jgi:hypothetical protein
MIMSAISAMPRSAYRVRLESVRMVASDPISESRWPPMRPERVVQLERIEVAAPSSSMSLVIAARPGRSCGSDAAPGAAARES